MTLFAPCFLTHVRPIISHKKKEKKNAYLVEILVLENIGREAPSIRPLDDKIQRLLHLAIQPPHVLVPIRLGQPLRGPLHRHDVLRRNDLSIVADPRCSVLEEALQDRLLRAEPVADPQLVVPGVRVLALVRPQLLGHSAAALLDLEAPVQLRRRVGLEVYARDEGRVEALL